jgi:hypothetical protein
MSYFKTQRCRNLLENQVRDGDNIKKDLREIQFCKWEVNEIASGSCALANFDVGDVESSSFTTRESVRQTCGNSQETAIFI